MTATTEALRAVASAALAPFVAGLLAAGCAVGHQHVGNAVRADAAECLRVGSTTRADVLRDFGPPDKLLRLPEGQAFLYEFKLNESRSLTISEPVFTNTDLYSWSESDDRSDRLLVLFDRDGRVSGFGFRRGTVEERP